MFSVGEDTYSGHTQTQMPAIHSSDQESDRSISWAYRQILLRQGFTPTPGMFRFPLWGGFSIVISCVQHAICADSFPSKLWPPVAITFGPESCPSLTGKSFPY